MQKKQNLTGMTREKLEQFVESLGREKYRGRQIYQWIYKKAARTFKDMTDLSRDFRTQLEDTAEIGNLSCTHKEGSTESGSVKYLFELKDRECVESVLIIDDHRRTLCVSSQIGCALNCRFCATAKLGFHRNLTPGEIIDQLLYVHHDTGVSVSNIVLMGMGEPFHNYEAVLQAAHLMTDHSGLGYSPRRIVISTAGVADKLYQYANEGHQYKLAISLNSPFQQERQDLMPIARRWKLDELLNAVRYYTRISKAVVTIEYVLFSGVNDSKKHAEALKKILHSLPCKLNLIPYNPVDDRFKRPDAETVDRFARWLLPFKSGLSVRWSKGTEINAACGQLAGTHQSRQNKEERL